MWCPITRSTGRTGSSSVACISSQPPSRSRCSSQVGPPGAALDAHHAVRPAAGVVLGAVAQRDRPQRAHPEAGVGQPPLPVEGHDRDGVRARRRERVADPAELAYGVVPQPLRRGREQRGVLEAVAAAAPAARTSSCTAGSPTPAWSSSSTSMLSKVKARTCASCSSPSASRLGGARRATPSRSR